MTLTIKRPPDGPSLLSSSKAWLYLASLLASTVVATSIGSAIGHFVKTTSGQSGAVNVISLSASLLSGVFVPQSIMNPSVLAAAKFLPTYWYMRANDAIAALPHIGAKRHHVEGERTLESECTESLRSVAVMQ